MFSPLCVRGGGLLHWLNNNHTLQVSENVANAAPTNSDSWNDAGNYSTTAPQGSGTETDPYLISTAEELAWISVNYSGSANGKYFKQTANIDLGAHYWVPINNSSFSRAYYYDGDNHTISNLFIDTSVQSLSSNNYIGLFGRVYGSSSNQAYIKNVNITSGSVSGDERVGAIVGYAYYTDITNCSNQGVSVSGDRFVGGVVGYVSGIPSSKALISSCFNTGSVEGSSYVGGVVGSNYYGNITSSYNTGDVTGTINANNSYVGGVVGYSNGWDEQISLCYNKGNIKSSGGRVGGISGAYGTITTCYNTGSVEGSSNVGGIFGSNGADTVYNCYYDSSKVSSSNSYGTPLTLEQMTVTQNGVAPVYMKYFYSSEWTFTEGETPTLHPYDYGTTEMPTLQDSGQANSQDNPYIIDSEAKLAYLSANSEWADEKYFLQTENLDFSSYAYFVPINIDGKSYAYYYDGGNKTISNLTIQTGRNYVGLFGYVYGSSRNHCYIKNLGIVNGSVRGERYVGAVVGYGYYADIANCWNEDTIVTGEDSCVGGIVGVNYYGIISDSYNTGTIRITNATSRTGSSGDFYNVGGIAGNNSFGTIRNSYNIGTVRARANVGGIVGTNDSGIISETYNMGSVSGNNEVGGVAGGIHDGGIISSSYNMGTITGFRYSAIGSSYVGGVVGYSQNETTISCSYNGGSVTGTGFYTGGVAGYLASGTINSSYNTAAVTGGGYVGGVAGCNYEVKINNSYNEGTIKGQTDVGGIAGRIEVRGNLMLTTISSCYNIGRITRSSGSDTTFGGVVGYIENSTNYPSRYVSISWCYYNTETVGSVVTKAIGEGNGYQCYGLTTAQMQGTQNENWMYLSDTVWNFASGSYPTLKYVATAQN